MSMDTCSSCGAYVDTDDDPECYVNDCACVCEQCRDTNEEAEWYAELNRGYAQDRI